MNWLYEQVTGFQFNSWMGVGLYWLPLLFCAYGYLIRTHNNYWKDQKQREVAEQKENGYYSPTDTIGTLIGRTIITWMPVGNIYAAMFDLAPEVFKRFFNLLERLFDQPLVPRRKK